MPYLSEITGITEFRGIKKLLQSIPLRKFNVLLGKNNSGKSSILEALLLATGIHFREPVTGENVLNFLSTRHGGSRRLIYKYSGRATVEVLLDGNELLAYSIDEHGNASDVIMDESIKASYALAPVVYLPHDTQFLIRVSRFLEEHEAEIVKNGIHTGTAREISRAIDEEFTEIVLKKDGWYLRRNDASYIYIEDAGDGVKKAAKAMMLIDLLQPKFVLWDDFDTALHPALLKLLLRWLAESSFQVVLSTHSIDVLYHLVDLNEELDEFDAQVLLLRKDEEDVLYHRELTMEELEHLLEGNVDPRILVSELKI